MKNALSKMIFAFIVCSAITCLFVSADETTLFFPDESGNYNVTFNEGTKDGNYALLVVEGTYTAQEAPSISQDDILYIDQQTADSTGKVTFENFKPKEEKNGTVYIGGSGLDSAILLGYLKKEAIQEITVPAGSTVYFTDGSTQNYDVETIVPVPEQSGMLYVNNGYTSHQIYLVDSGLATPIEDLNDAILGSAGTSIRTKDVNGIRFRSSASYKARSLTVEANKYELVEYGFIVTPETTKTGLKDTPYTLDMALVAEGRAKKGVAYNKTKGLDIFYQLDDYNQRYIFTNVTTGISMTRNALTTIIASRPYYIFTDGPNTFTAYGEITKRSIYDVAKALKDQNGYDYTENKDYIDEIISIAEKSDNGLDNEVDIDISDLLKP